jgi:hypothetical protein
VKRILPALPKCASVIAVVLLAAACTETRKAPIENIHCQVTVVGVQSAQEWARIERIIRASAVSSSLHPTSAPDSSGRQYQFAVKRLADLDAIHAQILYDPNGDPQRQLFNPTNASFSIHYDTVNLGGGVEVIVHFKVTPGARLFYKPEGDSETDITPAVSPSGDVALKTNIHKGQQYIYARTVAGQVQRFIRIDVYTQSVQEIPGSQYP